MSRAPLAAAIAAVPAVVAGTHVGGVLAARFAALLVAFALSLGRQSWLRALCALLVLAAALCVSLVGHAADWGDLTGAVAVDWVHAVAASAWSGGLVALALVVLPRARAWPRVVLAQLAQRFSRLAGACLLVTTGTGAYNAWSQLGGLAPLWATDYGRLLIVKLVLVLGLGLLGAINRYANLPRLDPQRAPRGFGARAWRAARLLVGAPAPRMGSAGAPARLAAYVRAEAIVARGILACTAGLGQVTPGRHAVLARKPTSHVTAAQPRSAGSSSRIGMVAPPAGDAQRGRRVFVRLRCFACHAVRGGGFPEPTHPGPDLSGVGSRPAGYLVESIMNPNALVVDGPGYTDARGLSTMPEYRDTLTVGELIDLVAYLRTLGESAEPSGRAAAPR